MYWIALNRKFPDLGMFLLIVVYLMLATVPVVLPQWAVLIHCHFIFHSSDLPYVSHLPVVKLKWIELHYQRQFNEQLAYKT